MAHDAGGRVVPQHPLDPLGRRVAAVGHDHHPGVLRVTHAHAAAVVQADPGGTARSVEQRVEQWPVGNGIAAVKHRLGLAVGRRDRARIEVIPADHDRGFELTRLDHGVEGQPGAVPLAQADPANARRQALEGDALGRHVQPAVQVGILGEQFFHLGVGLVNVLRVARQRDPAERPPAPAKQRPHIGRHKTREVKRVAHAGIKSDLANVVAVVHRGHAQGLKVQHGLHMQCAAAGSGLAQGGMLAAVGLRGAPAVDCPAAGQVAVDQVVGGGLVGHQVGADAALVRRQTRAPRQLGQDVGGIAQQADGYRFFLGGVALDAGQRVVQIGGLLVQVAAAQPKIDTALLALDVERASPGKGGRERLRTAHAAQASGQEPTAGQITAVVLAAGLDKSLVSALHDALAADVDPAAGGHLAVHHQALAVELVKMLPGGPLGHQVGVGDQHPRGINMGAEHTHRLARLHQQRLVIAQRFQAGQDGLKTVPVAGGLADAAVDHQRLGVLGHFGVEVVLQHAVGGLGQPAAAGQRAAARRTHHPGLGVACQAGWAGVSGRNSSGSRSSGQCGLGQVGHAGLVKVGR